MSERFYNSIIGVLNAFTKPFVRIKVTGIENIPETGGAIITPNHISNIDPLILGVGIAKQRHVRALAKESLFRKPVVKTVLRGMKHIPVHRGSATAARALETAIEQVKAGEVVGIYPEGTIPLDLQKGGAYKTGAVRLAASTGMPLIPVGQWGAHTVLPARVTTAQKIKHLTGALMKRPVHSIVVGEPYYVEEDYDMSFELERLEEKIRGLVAKAQNLQLH